MKRNNEIIWQEQWNEFIASCSRFWTNPPPGNILIVYCGLFTSLIKNIHHEFHNQVLGQQPLCSFPSRHNIFGIVFVALFTVISHHYKPK